VQVPLQTDLLAVYSLHIVQNQFNRHAVFTFRVIPYV